MKFLNYGVSKKSKKLGIKPYSKRKVPPAHLQGDLINSRKGSPLEVSGVFPRETKNYPSLNPQDFSPAFKKEKDVKSKERLKECKDEIKSTKDNSNT